MTNSKSRKRLILIISWVIVLIWMAFIFNLSAQELVETNTLSKGITKTVIVNIEKVAPESDFDLEYLNTVIRKNAHFIAYFVLGMLVLNAARRSGISGYKGLILTLGICILYAVSDEFHQGFVPGRSPRLFDVSIDSAGSILGILTLNTISRFNKNRDGVGIG